MNNAGARNREEFSPALATEATSNQQVQADSQSAAHKQSAAREDIEKQAFAIYERNGRQGGTSQKDWYEAERELSKEIVQEDRATERMVDEGSPAPEADRVSVD